jgi:hypothetical protein
MILFPVPEIFQERRGCGTSIPTGLILNSQVRSLTVRLCAISDPEMMKRRMDIFSCFMIN